MRCIFYYLALMPFIVNKNFSKTDEKLFEIIKKIDLMNINKKLFITFNYFRNAIKSDKILNSSLKYLKKFFSIYNTKNI